MQVRMARWAGGEKYGDKLLREKSFRLLPKDEGATLAGSFNEFMASKSLKTLRSLSLHRKKRTSGAEQDGIIVEEENFEAPPEESNEGTESV
jgi:hypothetical protein